MRIAMVIALLVLCVSPASSADRITILSDAFGRSPRLQQDWGYSALVEIGGKRILFDAGNDARKFEQNVRTLRVDLRRLDLVVISHRHGDHTAGLRYLRRLNPRVRIYAPRDEHFGGPTPAAFFRRGEPSLPTHMRYFDGHVPAVVPHGSAWDGIEFTQVESTTAVLPGVRLLSAISDAPGMRDLAELSLAIDTPGGQIVIVGCSHPGVDTILRLATDGGAKVRLIAGGFHWVTTPDAELRRLARQLVDDYHVESVAPGHCTGEAAFRELQTLYGDNYIYAGVGTVIPIH